MSSASGRHHVPSRDEGPTDVTFLDDADGAAPDRPDTELLDVGRSILPPRVHAALTGRRSRRAALAVLVAAVLAVAVTATVQWHRRSERAAAAQRSAAARHQAGRTALALDAVRSWTDEDDPYGITTLSTVRTPGCKDVDKQLDDPPQARVARELQAAFPGFRPRAVSRTIDESGRLCMLLVSVSDGNTVIVLRADPRLRRIIPAGSAAETRGADSIGYVSEVMASGWTTAVGWRGPAAYAPDQTGLNTVLGEESTRW